MAGPRTFDEDILFQDELDFDQFPDEKDKNPKDSKSLYEIALDIISGNKSLMRRILYSQYIEGLSFQSNVSYQGVLSSHTEFWINDPSRIKKQELPAFINGEWTYDYKDPIERPQMGFSRVISFRLNSGEEVRFAVYGSTQIPDTINGLDQISIEKLEEYMDAADSPHVFSGVDSQHMANLTGFELGMKEDIHFNESLRQVLEGIGLGSIAKVDMSAEELYKFILEFIEAHPSLDGWLSQNIKGTKNVHDDKGKASAAISGSRNSVVTYQEMQYHSRILGIDDLAAIAEQLRNRKQNPDAEGPLEKGETLEEARYQGKIITESDLIELFHKTVDISVIDPDGNELTNVLIFKMEGGYFGRQVLSKEDAHSYWRTLDTVGSPEDLRDWEVQDKFGIKWIGTFELLKAQGTLESHRIEENYYRGRRFFKSNKNVLNQTLLNDANDGANRGYAELTALTDDSGDHLYWYLRGELDRPATDAAYFRSIINTFGSKTIFAGSFQSDLGKWIYGEVNKHAKEYGIQQVSVVSDLLNSIWSSREALEIQLGSLPSMDKEDRRNIISAFGYEHDALDDLTELFSDKEKTADILLGVEVDGYTIEGITDRIGEAASEVDQFLGNIFQDRVDLLVIEGDFGNNVREYAYKKAGFSKLKHDDYPHDDQASNSYTVSKAHNYTNTKEQLYAYYVSNTEGWKLFFTILAIVVVAVVIALVTMGVGLFIAGAAGLTGMTAVVAGGAIAGVLFTVISEVILQSMGQGTLNRDKDGYGVLEFLGQMLLNAIMFAAFGALGEMFGTIAAAAKAAGASRAMMAALHFERIASLTILFTSYSLVHFYLENDRLPEGREWKKFWMENILALVLFEVGGAVAKTGLMRVRSAGYSKYAQNQTAKFNKAKAELIASQKAIAEISTGELKTQDVQVDMVDLYIKRLRNMEKMYARYRKKSDGTGWELRDRNDKKLSKSEAKKMEADLIVARKALEQAKLLKITGTEKIVGSDSTLSYNGTTKGANAIKKAHKDKGDSLLEVDETGRMSFKRSADDSIVEYLPDSKVSSESLQNVLLEEQSLKGSLRQITRNVMGVDEGKLASLKKQFDQGRWIEVKEGEMYFGEKEVNGEKVSMYFMVEEKLYITRDAWQSEQKQFGTGLAIIRGSLRSQKAIEGFNDYVQNKWKLYSEELQVKEFWKLEQKGKSEGKNLNEILEERAGEAIKERAAQAKAEFEMRRGGLKGASGKDYPVEEIDPKYKGEDKESKFEDPFGNNLYVKYLNESQRAEYEVFVGEKDGLLYDVHGDLINTADAVQLGTMGQVKSRNAIFVMDGKGRIYLSKKAEVGRFHHSSFLSGEPTSVAGEAKIDQTREFVSIFDNSSGHYPYGPERLEYIKLELESRGANMDRIIFQEFVKK